MSRGTSVLIAVLVSLFVGFLARQLIFPCPPPPASNGSVAVTVIDRNGSPPDVLPEKAKISTEDFVFWASNTKKKHIAIEFEEEVFVNMKKTGNRWAVRCDKRTCFSDEVKVPANPDKEYKYWQINFEPGHPENRKEKDGWVIIDR